MNWRPGNPWRDEGGAVAATYAIALMGLIVVAGVGYDYSRMVSLDSELQNAADQAALAAVTQLDRQSGACERASNAAVGLLRNLTMLSNDGRGNQVTVTGETACDATGTIRFFQDKDKTIPALTDEAARFVEVWVNPREAFYALTPVMANFNGSGDLHAAALAGMGSAICRVPPLMICNPVEPAANKNTMLDFDAESHVGDGIKLVANDSYTPGAFGFLQTEFGTGANGLLAALGWDVRGGDCVSVEGVEIKNGMDASVLDGINVRFDIPGPGQFCPSIDGITGVCSPSVSVRKDMTRNNSDNWKVHEGNSGNFNTEAYRPTAAATYDALYGAGTTPLIMGHPRDLCHAWSNNGNCANGRTGDGQWDINAYWRSNFGGSNYGSQIDPSVYGPFPPGQGYPSRYQVYRWEADQLLAESLYGMGIKDAGGGQKAYAQPQEGHSLALDEAPWGLVPGSGLDRRRISVAVLNCNALRAKYGNSLNNRELEVPTWIDVFLVEPSQSRGKCQGKDCNTVYTEKFDVYVELIERTDIGGDNGSAAQTIRRDVPYLIQ
ncbi:pilus assembly protein [Altererythrobacter aerius]|uniref:Pilus assembly protein n=1 Tax=Tsuneonella aeria TaxID=1837929 RepID=A0A6I4TEN4_9SPHN|nr:pilus assembly protein TadG-related protein [Tsuneonella aeria]MXO75234.1 pilus assembly protein [Tsuneonella aeria]